MVPYRVANLERLKPKKEYRKDHAFYELPAALDIETTKTGTDPDKDFAFVYLWAFAIGDYVVYGRTPEELQEFIPILRAELRLCIDFRLIVFVHFLKYEFAFLKKYLQIEPENFIARSKHEPLRIRCNDCLELRDSYAYTEQPLRQIGKAVGIPKLELEYSDVRTPETKLTDEELAYQANDVLILTRFFEQESNFYGGIGRLPLTATQRCKRYISAELARFSDVIKWRVYGQQLDPKDEHDAVTLQLLHIAFFGGFNFCNRLKAGEIIPDVYGADIDTSYGAQCLLHRFPRSRFKPLPVMPDGSVPDKMLSDIINARGQFKNKALLIVCEFDELKARVPELAFLPKYCKNYIYRTLDRKKSMKSKHLSDCGHVETVLTDIDFRLVCKWYMWAPGSLKIRAILGSSYAPLPEYVQNAIIDMIAQKKATKAELKEIKKHRKITEEENAEYHRIKSLVSRIYGVFVQDPLRMDYTWNEETQEVTDKGLHGLITGETTGKDKKRFTPVLYQWGVFVASWARFELMQIIERLAAIGGSDRNGIKWNRKLLYSDTDCVKWYGLGSEALAVIEEYNEGRRKRLEQYCTRRNINIEYLRGLGCFDIEKYTHFKALGLKQYAEIQLIDGKPEFDYHVAGLPRPDPQEEPDGTIKNKGCTFFDDFTDPLEKLQAFSENMEIPAEKSHLNGTYCIDDERSADIIDRDGNTYHATARSCILLVPRAFKLQTNFFERARETDPDELEKVGARNFEGAL